MRTLQDLEHDLRRLDGRGYKAYKAIAGAYRGARLTLWIDHVQGDPFGAPSRLRVVVAGEVSRLPEGMLGSGARRGSVADFLNRSFHEALRRQSSRRGSGSSGELRILRPGQEVLRRTSMVVRADGEVEARFRAGLPAAGRRILGREAAELLTRDIPAAVDGALLAEPLDEAALRRHVEAVEDAQAMREQLADRGLVAFVADGALLPRRSGVDDRPLAAREARLFESPQELRVTLDTPSSGPLSGLGIPRGVTLIVGGGYHGKSTLLRALERGVHDHIPGDGRERVVTIPGTVKVRAEDGRSVAGTDISNFIRDLPGGQETRSFRTENASGSTSQAAAIAEAIEAGATCLLLDEDTSATNFMIRDARMQALIAGELEPITPFIDRARHLGREVGVSTVIVVGGAGDYFDVADTVIAMRNYEPEAVTAEARRIAEELPSRRRQECRPWAEPLARIPLPDSLDPSRGRRDVSIKARREDRVLFGTEEVELSAVEQIVETAQTRAMAEALVWARGPAIDGRRTIREALEAVMEHIDTAGLEGLGHGAPGGELAEFRIHELAAFLNRVRSLRVRFGSG
ncbi:MAG: ABC-ATPase domain-containing protein [Planctomycetota bacterium]